MRNLVFKNLTSSNRRKKVLFSSVVLEKKGLKSVIQRRFVYIAKEVNNAGLAKPLSELHVVKEHNSLEQRERFFCKLKGSVRVSYNKKIYLVVYLHSLNITLTPATHPALP